MTFLASVLAGAIFLTGVCSASATTLTWTDATPATATDWTDTFSGTKFNSALGTLNSVDVYLWGNVTGNLKFTNNSNNSKNYSQATLGTDLTLQLPSALFLTVQAVHSYTPNILVPKLSTVTSDIFNAASSTTQSYSDLATLSAFTGTGNIDLLVESMGFAGYLGSSNLTVESFSDSAASIQVTYDYTPTPPPIATPEPSTLMLLGGSLVGLAFWRRRKQ